MNLSVSDIAGMIDHSLLTPTLTTAELEEGCADGVRYGVASLCILPFYVKRCAEILRGSPVHPSTVIGFPHGGHATGVKQAEARQALEDGAVELDMVVNINQVRSGDWDYVRKDIDAVIQPAHAAGATVKVIFENAYLDRDMKIALCTMCGELGADWVKTSTGFGPSGATLEDLKLMVEHVHHPVQVKAAGGVRDLDFILAARDIGVTRVGSSRTGEILEECRRRIKEHP